MTVIPVQKIVNLIWVRENYKFFQGDIITQEPIASTLVYWYKLNYPHIYAAYQTEAIREITRNFGPQGNVVLRGEELPLLPEGLVEEIQQLEWDFQQELKETNLDLLYFRHKEYERFQQYVNLPLQDLPVLTSKLFAKSQLSEDCQITFHLMEGNLEQAMALVEQKLINRNGFAPNGETLERNLGYYLELLQQDQILANQKIQETQQVFQAKMLTKAKKKFKKFFKTFSKPHPHIKSHPLENTENVPEAVSEPSSSSYSHQDDRQTEFRAVVNTNNSLPPSDGTWAWFGSLLPLGIVIVAKGISLLFNKQNEMESPGAILSDLRKLKDI
uniref:Uncharacterized protein n=1 Tax=Caulerpa racemosa TaxID=76317 RepID=A0A1I9LKD1_CAURA|nr:hypothetical protein [Caulerpa racemosa]ANJ70792.1 hypothetical protein [Caulerpa racemosa]